MRGEGARARAGLGEITRRLFGDGGGGGPSRGRTRPVRAPLPSGSSRRAVRVHNIGHGSGRRQGPPTWRGGRAGLQAAVCPPGNAPVLSPGVLPGGN